MKSATTRVLIVEDHQVVAEGLAALINDQEDMTVIGHSGSVSESIAQAAELKPDLVLIDFRLTDGTGADAATGIRQLRPETKLIFLTREDSDAARFAALESGASAFIHKSRAAQEVVDAIRTVAHGGSLFTPRSIAQLLNSRREVEAQLERLTPREKEVLRLPAKQRLAPALVLVQVVVRGLVDGLPILAGPPCGDAYAYLDVLRRAEAQSRVLDRAAQPERHIARPVEIRLGHRDRELVP